MRALLYLTKRSMINNLKKAGMSTGFVFPVIAFSLFAVAMFMLESLMTILLIHSWKKQSVIEIMRN